MSALVADTHSAIWYLFKSPALSPRALVAIRATIQGGDPVRLSALTMVEVAYLVEKGRLPGTAFDVLEQALVDPLAGFALSVLDLDVARMLRRVPRALIPDMPDRIITATALHLGLPLVTADQQIRSAGIVTTIW
jgi:PIN domain nuclease of toxin-antitoxin system